MTRSNFRPYTVVSILVSVEHTKRIDSNGVNQMTLSRKTKTTPAPATRKAPTRKTATPATPAPVKRATRKAPATPAPARKSETMATPAPEKALMERIDKLEGYIATLAKKVELCEAREGAFVGVCNRFEAIIKALMATPAPVETTPATPAPSKATPAPANKAPKATPAPKTATPAPASYSALLSQALDSVIDGIEKGLWCENLVAQCDYDLRFFCDRTTRKAIKDHCKATPESTLKQFSIDLVELFSREVDATPDQFNPLTLECALASRVLGNGKTPAPVME